MVCHGVVAPRLHELGGAAKGSTPVEAPWELGNRREVPGRPTQGLRARNRLIVPSIRA